jgi:hypothetical protein
MLVMDNKKLLAKKQQANYFCYAKENLAKVTG